MHKSKIIIALAALCGLSLCCHAKDDASKVKKVIERSTLNQPGTKPFHLRAVITPSRADRGADRTGEVEIWWASPTEWKREVRSPEFHQIVIVNGAQEWQKSEGDYFPEWLRETAVALVDPVPDLDRALKMVNEADVKTMFGNTYYAWMTMSTDGNVEKGMGATIAVTDKTGLLFYCGDLGWGALFKDYKNFHGRMVATTVTHGTPEVTARVTTLEELRDTPPGLFDAAASGGDVPLLHTVIGPAQEPAAHGSPCMAAFEGRSSRGSDDHRYCRGSCGKSAGNRNDRHGQQCNERCSPEDYCNDAVCPLLAEWRSGSGGVADHDAIQSVSTIARCRTLDFLKPKTTFSWKSPRRRWPGPAR
ncbi:MAG TPA: hypothetical protein VJW94_10505 [Candidatus Acidoferrum sp.]|nr:hypothetical protein [Candidatus Acidoferrum sp.]